MSLDKFDFEKLTEERRKSICKTIQPIDINELKNVGNTIFPWVDDAWREVFFGFIDEHRGCNYYHALTSDNVHIVYCREADRGIWYLPGVGKGPLQARGLQAMKVALEKRR